MGTTAGNTDGENTPFDQPAVMECRTPESLLNNPPRRIGAPALKAFATFVAAAAMVAPQVAEASGGNYVFQGGTPYEQAQVRLALNASTFNWNLVPEQITIEIDRSVTRDESIPGEIFLSPDLLDAGELSWGVVQNEYAHQVDSYLLTDAQNAIFNTALGGTAWCYADQPGLQLAQYGCERFASTLAWAYWQSPNNCIQPSYVGAVAAGMSPAAFRAFLSSQLGMVTTSVVHTTRQTHTTRLTQSAKKR